MGLEGGGTVGQIKLGYAMNICMTKKTISFIRPIFSLLKALMFQVSFEYMCYTALSLIGC